MRRFAPILLGICVLGLVGPALATEPQQLEGIWHGDQNGAEVVWRFDAAGRLKLDGRRASWKVSGDSLLVEFEPLGNSNCGEKAVYRFVASDPNATYRRLFVYGFDLGQNGLLLTREISDEDLARLQAAVKIGGESFGAPAVSAAPRALSAAPRQ